MIRENTPVPDPDGDVDPSAAPAAAPPPTGPDCDICGTPMYDLHCKIVCACCGYKRDCSDP